MLIYSVQVIILDQTSSAKVKLRSCTDIDRIWREIIDCQYRVAAFKFSNLCPVSAKEHSRLIRNNSKVVL